MARQVSGQHIEKSDTAKTPAGTLTLSGASQQVVPANTSRSALYVSNTSAANKMFLALGAVAAVASAGVMIPANTTLDILNYSGEVRVIGTAADVLSFSEV